MNERVTRADADRCGAPIAAMFAELSAAFPDCDMQTIVKMSLAAVVTASLHAQGADATREQVRGLLAHADALIAAGEAFAAGAQSVELPDLEAPARGGKHVLS